MAESDIARLLAHRMLPTFTLQTADGGEFSTWSAKGSKSLLVLIFGKVCNPECRTLLARVAREYKQYKELSAEVIAIMRMNRESADEIRLELGLPFPVLVDVDGTVTQRIGYGLPAVLVTDRYGEIVADFVGDEALKVKQEQLIARVELNELECPE